MVVVTFSVTVEQPLDVVSRRTVRHGLAPQGRQHEAVELDLVAQRHRTLQGSTALVALALVQQDAAQPRPGAPVRRLQRQQVPKVGHSRRQRPLLAVGDGPMHAALDAVGLLGQHGIQQRQGLGAATLLQVHGRQVGHCGHAAGQQAQARLEVLSCLVPAAALEGLHPRDEVLSRGLERGRIGGNRGLWCRGVGRSIHRKRVPKWVARRIWARKDGLIHRWATNCAPGGRYAETASAPPR